MRSKVLLDVEFEFALSAADRAIYATAARCLSYRLKRSAGDLVKLLIRFRLCRRL